MLIKGLELPFGIKPVDSGPVDSWSGPFITTSEALASIPKPIRFLTMQVRITGEAGGSKMYWFKDGVEDTDLVLMNDNSDIIASINSEISARTAGDILLYEQLTGETEERILGDVTNYNLITGLTESLAESQGSISGLTQTVIDNYNLLTGETQTRTLEDIRLNNLITGETEDRILEDIRLNNLITGETESRVSEDIRLNNLITGLTQTITDNYNLLTGETEDRVLEDIRLNNLITGLTQTVTDNYNLLTGETENRVLEDIRLNNLITGLTQTVIDNYNLLTGETENRALEDIRLNNLITGLTQTVIDNYNLLTGETENRVLEDIRLNNLITGETQTRTSEDIRLNNLITGETEARTLEDIRLNEILTGHTHPQYLTGYTETDPIYESEKHLYSLTGHTHQQYLTSETDPVFSASDAAGITSTDIANWNSKQDALPFVQNTEGKFLRDDNTFEYMEPPVGGFANNLYFSEIVSDVSTYKTLSYTPDVITTDYLIAVSAADGDKLVGNYLYPSEVSVDLFPSGLWSFSFYGYISTASGDTRIGVQYFKRSTGGTETDLFTAWSDEINNITNAHIKFDVTNPTFAVEPSDRMGARIFVKTSYANPLNISFAIGDGYGAYLNNPNRIRHSQLRALNQDPFFLHITQAEKNKYENAYDYSQIGHLALSGGTVSGNVTIAGDLIVTGSTYQTDIQDLNIKDAYIKLRDGAIGGLADGEYTGIEAIKYDGANNGRLVFDNTGTARVGDVGSEQPLTTRDESLSMLDNGLIYWSASENKIKTTTDKFVNKTGDTITGTYNINGNVIINPSGITAPNIAYSSDLNSYVTKIDAESRYVHVTGDTITGNLTVNQKITTNDAKGYYIGNKLVVSTYSWGGDDSNAWLGGAINNTVTGIETYEGNNLIAIGINALSGNTTGFNNIAVGVNTLTSNTIGSYNTALGGYALYSNTDGEANTAIGDSALYSNQSGYNNTSIGVNTLYSNTSGWNNIAIGAASLYNNTIGGRNTAIGDSALFNLTDGKYNIAIGDLAGAYIEGVGSNTLSDNSIYIGSDTRPKANNELNQIVIGHNAKGNGSNTTTIGNTNTIGTYLFGTLSGNTNAFFSGNVTATGFTENGTALSDKYLGISTIATSSILGSVKIGSNVTITDGVISVHNPITLGTANGLSLSTQVLSLGLASASANGALSSTDWSTFNAKQAKLTGTGASSLVRVNTLGTIAYDDNTYLTANQTITLSGIITGSGTTAITTAIADNALSIAKTNGLQTALDAKMTTSSYPDLVAIEALTGTSGFLKKTAANTWSLDTNTYLTTATAANTYLALSGGTLTSVNGSVLIINSTDTYTQIDFRQNGLSKSNVGWGETLGGYLGNKHNSVFKYIVNYEGNLRYGTASDLKLVYHSGNSNLTTIDWSAKNLTLNGSISGATTGSFSGNVSALSFTENGTTLASKYLGILAKAADSDKLDGQDSTYFATATHNHNETYALISGATTQDFQVKALTMNGALSGATTITVSDRNAYYIGSKLMLSDYSWGGDDNNVWIGVLNSTVTGSTNTEGNYNTAVGYQTLMSTTTGYDNAAIGSQALKVNTTGYENSVVGSKALMANTTGYRNCAFGQESLGKNVGGINNIAIGYKSLYNTTSSSNHVAIGINALLNNTNGFNNTAIGGSALSVCTSGYYNVAIGFEALGGISEGYRDIGIGYQAGRSTSAGGLNYGATNSIYIGHETKAGGIDQTNEIVIGNQTIGRGSNTTTIGNTGTTAAYIFGNLMLGFASNPGSYKLAVSGTTYFSDDITAPNIAYSSDLVNLLTTTQADELYLTKTDASVIYLTNTGATETYLSKTDAANTYLPISGVTDVYLTKTDASETYLNKSAASGDTMSGPFTLNNTLSVLTNTITGKTAGTSTIYTLATSKGNCMIIDYTVYNTGKTALRSGTVMCNFTDVAITYKEDSTADINSSTEDVKFVPSISGANVIFQTVITGPDTWNFKLSVRYF